MPRILYIVLADYDALKTKGVEEMIFERDEGGFFNRVVTVHPVAKHNRTIKFNDAFVLYEIGFNIFGWMPHSRLLRALLSPFHFIRAVIFIFRIICVERIDLIRANDPFWIGLIGLTVAKLSRRPFCVSIHADYDKCQQLTGGGNTYTFFRVQWPARLVCRLVLSSANMVLPIRESLRQWAISHGASPKRIKIIPHGIDTQALDVTDNFNLREMFDISADRKIISFVGRLSPENYLSDVIEITRRLATRRDDFCLVIAGGGKLEGWLKELLTCDSQLSKVVRLVGFQPRKVCFALRRQSAVSLCLMGGFSLIEACLARRPVISYDVEWHSELIQTGRTGFLVPERDIDAVLNAVERCLDEKEMAATLGREAYNLAISKHDLRNTSKIKRECYEELLK